MSEKNFTHKDLADLLGVSETTVKSYRRKFPGCIPVASNGKPIRFTAAAADVATRIRDLFETGMSVEEVRLRLAKEFTWITPEAPKSAAAPAPEKTEMAPEISVGVSNMAKSMVAMTQQQKAILTRMQGIEALLEDLGLKGQVDAGAMRQKNVETTRLREEKLETRLDQLDEATKGLAGTVSSLADQLERFLGNRAKAAEEWRRGADSDSSDNSANVGLSSHSLAHQPVQEQTQTAKVIPMRPVTEASTPPAAPAATGEGNQVMGQAVTQHGHNAAAAEPPRHLLALPLVVRTGQGQYISAGGRGRGRFCVNDLKAMLIYGYTPPNHFSLRWEAHGQGWWLVLEQAGGGRVIHLLLMELPTQKGSNVAEILQLKNNNETLHPAEICSIIDSFSE